MHAMLLIVLGPLGLNTNSVVWPWNALMPILALVAFLRNDDPILAETWHSVTGKIMVALVGIFPALSFVGLWDSYLSASLYSGKTTEAVILLDEEGASEVPPEIQGHIIRTSGKIGLEITGWSIAELNVPPYPEVRVYEQVAAKLHLMGVRREHMDLVVAEHLDATSSKPQMRSVPVP
jgi:hypothetical protein